MVCSCSKKTHLSAVRSWKPLSRGRAGREEGTGWVEPTVYSRLGVKAKQKPGRRLHSATAASRGQNRVASSLGQSVPGRKEEAGPEHRAITRCAGAQWKAVAGERMVSHHSDPWREKQERRMLCLLVTNSNSPSLFLQPWQLQGCRPFWQPPSLPWCNVPVSAPPGWLCHFWVTDIDQDCSLNSGGWNCGWVRNGRGSGQGPDHEVAWEGGRESVLHALKKGQEVIGGPGIDPCARGIRGSRIHHNREDTIATGITEGVMHFCYRLIKHKDPHISTCQKSNQPVKLFPKLHY